MQQEWLITTALNLMRDTLNSDLPSLGINNSHWCDRTADRKHAVADIIIVVVACFSVAN